MEKAKKERIDIILFEKGLVESREKGSRLILAGQVFANDFKVTKPSIRVDVDSHIRIKELFPYVGKGAQKLESAFIEFKMSFENKVIVDVGSSTGGFTDYALKNGAKKVYAVDVGYGQLAQKLREDDRVVSMERTDIRNIDSFPEKIDVFVVDVSFISLEKILPKIKEFIDKQKQKAEIVCLVKPQFEVGKKIADRFKGVISDIEIQNEIVEKIINFSLELNFLFKGKTESQIKGHKGNQEYLIYLES
ncbi:TlyA family RNA methyltransferase [bacterium]|nr:TlyA family RNA methyltransferase [bacterium]